MVLESLSRRLLTCAILALFVVPLSASAQTPTATVTGTAYDASGAVLPGVCVAIMDVDRKTTQTSVTNEIGGYVLPALPPGRYSVSAEREGFRVDRDLIVRSPVRRTHKPAVERQEKQAWSPDQVRRIIEDVPDEHRAFFTCAALTGARLGELLALKWSCVDFDARTVRIERNLWQRQLVSPKTMGSIRTIAFGEMLARVLTDRMQASAHIGPDDFVFSKPDGTPYHPDVLRKDVLYPTLDRLRIPRLKRASGFHAFRHAAATVVSAATGNLKLAQKLLGHTQLATTADVYTHVLPEQDASAVEALVRAVFPNSVPNCSQNGPDPILGTDSEG